MDLYGNGTDIDLGASSDNAAIYGSNIYGSTGDGIDIGADNATITGNTIYGNQAGSGIDIAGDNPLIADNTIYGNGVDYSGGPNGVETQGSDPTVENNIIFDNSNGISVSSDGNGLISGNDVYASANDSVSVTSSGNGDLIVTGNEVHDNSGDGIDAAGPMLVVGNTVYGNAATGIDIGDGTEASDNIVYDNKDGIVQEPNYDGFGQFDATADTIDGNRVFGNANTGITALDASSAVDNDVYSNGIGIEGDEYYYSNPAFGIGFSLPFQGTILNNVVYANSSAGILIAGASSAQVTNNTVYQPEGDGVQVTAAASSGDSSQNVVLLNNILWTQSGYDIDVSNDSQQGFQSNYNLLYTTGTGNIGYWQTSFADLNDWQVETGFDAQSITGDPKFVNANGPNGILGFDPATGIDGGPNDDFHLQNGSPAVAAGDPASDYSAQPAPTGGRINLGAFGDTPQATTAASAGVIVDPTGGSTKVVNGGADGSYTIVLTSQPASDVTITLTPDSQLTLSTTTLTFTSADWDVAQTVTVKAVFNPAETGDETAAITLAVASTDANYNGLAVPSITVQVVPQSSTVTSPTPTPTTSLSTASVSGTYGSTATLTATLTSGGSPLPGETVYFTLDEAGNVTPVGTATTNVSGVATLSGVSLAGFNAGTYADAVGASFAGDATYGGSSAGASLTVNPAPTQGTSLSAASATGTYGGTATLAATLTAGGAPLPGETVSFTLAEAGNVTPVGTATTDASGVATLSGVSLAGFNTGSYPAVAGASFAGDSTYGGSSASGSLTVNPAPTQATSLSTASATGTYGGTATLAATLTAGGVPLPGETVYFTLDEAGSITPVGTATSNASGVATLSGVSLSSFNAGTYAYAVGAIFAGDLTDEPTSASGNLSVNRAAATLNLSGLAFTYDGTPHTATVSTVPAGLAGVTVTYSQSAVAVAAPTQAGSYTVSATLNNSNYIAVRVTGTLVINLATPTPTPTSTPSPTPTQTMIIGEQPLFHRKTNKKGKPTGKAALSGFLLEFDVPLNSAAASNAATYQVETVTTKKVEKKKETILHPITKFTVSYLAASDAVEITLGAKETFPAGGQITILSGLTTRSGTTLSGTAVFTIAKGGKSIGPA